MKKATISHTKNNLSALLDRVRHGETVLITDRDRPVARLEPLSAHAEAGGDRLARLERAGLVRQGAGTLDPEIARKAPPSARKGGDILAALLADREAGR